VSPVAKLRHIVHIVDFSETIIAVSFIFFVNQFQNHSEQA